MLGPALEVIPLRTVFLIKGVVHSTKEHKTIEEEAAKIAGDILVKYELHYR